MTKALAPVQEQMELTETKPTGNPLYDMIERASMNPNVDADKFAAMVKLANEQEDRARQIAKEDERDHARKIFMSCRTKVTQELPQIVKDAYNKQTSSNYATMEKIDAVITPIITKYGFHISFEEGDDPRDDEHLHIIAVLGHEEGHEKSYNIQVPIAGVGMKGNRMMTATHGYGATKTYGRRYAKLDIFDIALMGADSDGNVNNYTSENLDEYRAKVTSARGDKSKLLSVRADIMADTDLTGPERTEAINVFKAQWSALPESERLNG